MAKDIFDVSGSVVLVSGGSRGIGEGIALGFAERDANVVVTGRDAATISETAKRLSVGKGEVTGVVCDVADEAAIDACVAEAMAKHGRIDTLVNCAGLNIRKPAEDYTAEEFDFILGANLRGAFLMSQCVGRHMIARKSGSQINIDSLTTYSPMYSVTPYSMSKMGMSAMTRGLALEWGPHGVRVNGLAPGFIVTDLTQKMWSDPNMQNWSNVVTPLRRLGIPADMAGTALFLASEASSFLTGQILRVDGGVSAGGKWPLNGEFRIEEA